jgi:collagenase-like PrtC family protease
MTTPQRRPLIVAPVSSEEQAEAAFSAGADELYCGILTDSWESRFGQSDQMSRRQGRASHVATLAELERIVRLSVRWHRSVALTLNGRYASNQIDEVEALAANWEDMGGMAVIVSDLGLLLRLAQRGARLRLHLSLLAGVFNSAAAQFFAEAGVSRIILPRDLALDEFRSLIAGCSRLEYEALALNQKCLFIDGMCGFYHQVALSGKFPAAFEYQRIPGQPAPLVFSHDPDYAGHGCELAYTQAGAPVERMDRDDWNSPHCAACQMRELVGAGVGFLKIGGRGYPTEALVRSVSFLFQARDVWRQFADSDNAASRLRALYGQCFGRECGGARCYYKADRICPRQYEC